MQGLQCTLQASGSVSSNASICYTLTFRCGARAAPAALWAGFGGLLLCVLLWSCRTAFVSPVTDVLGRARDLMPGMVLLANVWPARLAGWTRRCSAAITAGSA